MTPEAARGKEEAWAKVEGVSGSFVDAAFRTANHIVNGAHRPSGRVKASKVRHARYRGLIRLSLYSYAEDAQAWSFSGSFTVHPDGRLFSRRKSIGPLLAATLAELLG